MVSKLDRLEVIEWLKAEYRRCEEAYVPAYRTRRPFNRTVLGDALETIIEHLEEAWLDPGAMVEVE